MAEESKKTSGYDKRPLWQWIVLYLIIGGIVYGLVYYFVLSKNGGYNSQGNIQYIDSQDDPKLGLAGYSSGQLQIGGRVIHMRLLAPDRKKVMLNSFPCENGQVTAVGGDFKILAFNDVSDKDYIDKFELGYKEFVMDPPTIEQTGLFSKLVTLSKSPRYEAFTLSFRRSCFDTEIFFYSFNPIKNKIVQLSFENKNGTHRDSITIPKGTGIPQIDQNGNIISSIYNPTTKMRDKTRYAFDINSFGFKALESYSQPE